MFYKNIDKDLRSKNKVNLLSFKSNMKAILELVVNGENNILVPEPPRIAGGNKFRRDFLSFVDENNCMIHGYAKLEDRTANIEDYLVIHKVDLEFLLKVLNSYIEDKKEYEKLKKFKGPDRFFSDKMADQVRLEYDQGISQKQLKEKYKCSKGLISNVVNFKGAYRKKD